MNIDTYHNVLVVKIHFLGNIKCIMYMVVMLLSLENTKNWILMRKYWRYWNISLGLKLLLNTSDVDYVVLKHCKAILDLLIWMLKRIRHFSWLNGYTRRFWFWFSQLSYTRPVKAIVCDLILYRASGLLLLWTCD